MNLAEAKEYAKKNIHNRPQTAGRLAGKIAVVTGGAQGFGLGIAEEMYREGGLFRIDPDQPFYHLRQPELFREKMEALIRIVQSGREHDRAVCLLETLLFTVQADAESAPEETDYYRERFAELMARIAKCPEKKWDFEEEARKMSVSLNHFNRLFRKYHQTSPHHCVIRARMRKAAELLLNTNASVAEIALAVGLENEFYFSRLFKKRFSLPPDWTKISDKSQSS